MRCELVKKEIMEWSYLVCFTIVSFPVLILLFRTRKSTFSNRLPPGPPGWPLFGHIFNLGNVPHRTTAELKQKYGPVLWLKIGSVNTMVILTQKAAIELFKNNDLAFADRSIVETMTSHNYHKGSMALAPYGSHWRVLRRICTMEMFVNRTINETAHIRRKCVDNMVSWIEKEMNTMEGREGIHVARYVFLALFNMLGNLMLSRDLASPESREALEFFNAMKGIMEWSGHANISDLFPWLRWLDLQGLKRKSDRDMAKAIGIASKFVEERTKELKTGGEKKKDFLDVLLEFQGGKDENAGLSEHEIIIFILELFLAGSETTSTSIEWALAELLRNPVTMTKVKDELSCVVGPNKKFEETDIDNLPYLHAVIKETLRLHPPLPFLIPRRATCDTNFMGYSVPRNTQVLVNVWAIGRDEECWKEPFRFKPERFIGSKTDYKGQHFEFIPFGAGRRICAGLPLGHRVLHFVLGTLLHEFDWELANGAEPNTPDMKERMGVAVSKLEPLKVVARKCVM